LSNSLKKRFFYSICAPWCSLQSFFYQKHAKDAELNAKDF
jgi:hypothetical protein